MRMGSPTLRQKTIANLMLERWDRDHVARDAAWLRQMSAVRMRQAGLTYKEIAKRLNVDASRAIVMVRIGEQRLRWHEVMPPSFRVDLAIIARDVRMEYHRLTGVWLK